MKRLVAFVLTFVLVSMLPLTVFAENEGNNGAESDELVEYTGDIPAESAVLMEAKSGKVLLAFNADRALAPASVTKIMTLLLVAEAIESGAVLPDDPVVISANAASMGGSQVFLKEGERFTVEELIKCTVIASANDAAVALAERVAGSESAFVRMMNARAMELGMKSTNFENTTGLDDTTVNHKTSALDIAIMSKELLRHEIILKYSSVWQDSIRGGEFVLTNTNRLVRFYDGCTGLKTGSTSCAGFCMSATAERGGMHLIAVVMGAKTRDTRNTLARELLDFGFLNYSLYSRPSQMLEACTVNRGTRGGVMLSTSGFSAIVKLADVNKIEARYDIPESIDAPLKKGDAVGKVTYSYDGVIIGTEDIVCTEKVEKIDFSHMFKRLILSIFYKLC